MTSLVCASTRGITGVRRRQVRKDKSTKLCAEEIKARNGPSMPAERAGDGLAPGRTPGRLCCAARGAEVAELHPEMAVVPNFTPR
jgi:hypothetical protein